MSRPESLRRYNAISPSAGSQRPHMSEQLRALAAQRDPLSAALHVCVGDHETRANLRSAAARQ